MSIEVIPEAFRESFDPLAGVDHDVVKMYAKGRIFSGRGVREELQSAFRVNQYHSRELVERMINYGKFLEPYDDELEAIDESNMRLRVFIAGTALALVTSASLAFEGDVDQLEWRNYWAQLPENADAPLNIKIDRMCTPNDCYKIGAAIMEIGQRNLGEMEDPYCDLVDEVDNEYTAAGEYSNIFRASYGYVFGIGRRVIHDVAYPQAIETEIIRSIPDVDDFIPTGLIDKEYEQLLVEEVRGV